MCTDKNKSFGRTIILLSGAATEGQIPSNGSGSQNESALSSAGQFHSIVPLSKGSHLPTLIAAHSSQETGGKKKVPTTFSPLHLTEWAEWRCLNLLQESWENNLQEESHPLPSVKPSRFEPLHHPRTCQSRL